MSTENTSNDAAKENQEQNNNTNNNAQEIDFEKDPKFKEYLDKVTAGLKSKNEELLLKVSKGNYEELLKQKTKEIEDQYKKLIEERDTKLNEYVDKETKFNEEKKANEIKDAFEKISLSGDKKIKQYIFEYELDKVRNEFEVTPEGIKSKNLINDKGQKMSLEEYKESLYKKNPDAFEISRAGTGTRYTTNPIGAATDLNKLSDSEKSELAKRDPQAYLKMVKDEINAKKKR